MERLGASIEPQKTINRREFLRIGAMTGIVVGTSALFASFDNIFNKELQEINLPKTEDSQPVDVNNNKNETSLGSYFDTFVKNAVLIHIKGIANDVVKKAGFKVGNANVEEIKQQFRDAPIDTTIMVCAIAPATEEALFRLIPSGFASLFSKDKNSAAIGIGTASSLLFAFTHNIIKENGKTKIAKNIPISHFLGGMFYWHLVRQKGFSHAVLAHSSNNAAAILIERLLLTNQSFPEPDKQKEKVPEDLAGGMRG